MSNSKYDDRYEIRLANYDDIDLIMDFINQNWKKGHILSKDKALFEYEFLEENGDVNVLIAIDREKQSLESMTGILKSSHTQGKIDVWGAMSRTKNGNMPFLGMELWKRRKKYINCRYELGIGLTINTSARLQKNLYKSNLYYLKHYYMLSERTDYKIAVVNEKKISSSTYIKAKKNVVKMKSICEVNSRYDYNMNVNCIPYKDSWYLEHRFFNHIKYHYDIYGIGDINRISALLVLREQKYVGRTVVRIVDYWGDHTAILSASDLFESILNKPDVEYIDFWCYGFEDELLHKMGFSCVDENSSNIIPSYFEPFVQENISILASSPVDNVYFFKADGDQERPNM